MTFSNALKTGTSQGWRDAWTVAFSQKVVVGVWVGRGDAGTMRNVSGAAAPARLANALITSIHGARLGEIADGAFPAPEGRASVELCATTGLRNAGHCGQTLTEWLRPEETPAFDMPAAQARAAGAQLRMTEAPARIEIASPENDTRLWRNPEQPEKLNTIALKARVGAGVELSDERAITGS